jgi:hypothetical protein
MAENRSRIWNKSGSQNSVTLRYKNFLDKLIVLQLVTNSLVWDLRIASSEYQDYVLQRNLLLPSSGRNFYLEDEGSRLFRNVDLYLPIHVTSSINSCSFEIRRFITLLEKNNYWTLFCQNSIQYPILYNLIWYLLRCCIPNYNSDLLSCLCLRFENQDVMHFKFPSAQKESVLNRLMSYLCSCLIYFKNFVSVVRGSNLFYLGNTFFNTRRRASSKLITSGKPISTI